MTNIELNNTKFNNSEAGIRPDPLNPKLDWEASS